MLDAATDTVPEADDRSVAHSDGMWPLPLATLAIDRP